MGALKSFFENIVRKWRGLPRAVRWIAVISAAALVTVIIFFAVKSAGGGKSEHAPTPAPSAAPTLTPTPAPTLTPVPTVELHPGEAKSSLTGEYVPEEVLSQRPYAVMLSNIEVASPQSGVGEASVLYEALTEAGITRLMAIYENLTGDSPLAGRIGSVRSARHYFASFADVYDAIFIHYGETKYAAQKIDKLGLEDIEGISGIGDTVFYRDTNIKAPHNAFATLEGIEKAVSRLGYRTEHTEDFEAPFVFYSEDTEPGRGVEAGRVDLPYSAYMSPYFVYDSTGKVYRRFQFGGLHTDYNTGEPLEFKNIIIQVVEESDIDKNGYQTMNIEDNSGKGYYITDGRAVEITWEMDEGRRFLCYYDADGNKLRMNPGKTFISVFPDFRAEKLSFSSLTEETDVTKEEEK